MARRSVAQVQVARASASAADAHLPHPSDPVDWRRVVPECRCRRVAPRHRPCLHCRATGDRSPVVQEAAQ